MFASKIPSGWCVKAWTSQASVHMKRLVSGLADMTWPAGRTLSGNASAAVSPANSSATSIVRRRSAALNAINTPRILSRCRPERVAGARVARLHPALEPGDALRRRAVRDAVGHHAAGRLALQAIVSNRGGGSQRLVGVARLELDAAGPKASLLRCGVAPDAGVAVRLQLEGDRRAVRARSRPLHAFGGPQQVLHVMTDLVRDDIRLREVAGRAEALRQLAEESEIEVDLPIARAVERAGRRLREAARRLDGVAEQLHACALIASAEQLFPGLLRVPRHRVDEVDQPLFFRRRLHFAGGAHRGGARRVGAEQ